MPFPLIQKQLNIPKTAPFLLMRNGDVLFTFPLCFPNLLYDIVLMELAVGVPSSSSWFECFGHPVLPVLLWLSCLKTNVSPLEFCAHKFWRKNHSKFCFPSNVTTLKIESLVFQVNLIHQKWEVRWSMPPPKIDSRGT